MNVVNIIMAARKLAPVVAELVVQLVNDIASSTDPEAHARRLIEESVRLRAFDAAARKLAPRHRTED